MTRACGFIAIIGEPNAGKSTLLNALVGEKISIVTPKVQTTRSNVRGVLTEGAAQMIFVDTPGIFTAPEEFEQAMVKAAWGGAGDADAIVLLIDAKKGITDNLTSIIQRLLRHCERMRSNPSTSKKMDRHVANAPRDDDIPIFVAINKVDKAAKERLLALATALADYNIFRDIFFISALKKEGLEALIKTLKETLPEGEFLYPEDQVSDVQMRMLAAEITREKLFMLLSQELPYAILVETEEWKEDQNKAAISQIIYVQREAHKKIVIGEGGTMIKRIGTSARKELEKMLDKKVHLQLFVKVRADWKESGETYRLLGLER